MGFRSAFVVVALAVAGCSAEMPGELGAAKSPVESGATATLLPTPVVGAAEVPQLAPFSMSPVACVQRSFTSSGRLAPCLVREVRANGHVWHEREFDASNHQTEERYFGDFGPTERLTTYRADGQPDFETYVDQNDTGFNLNTDWKYDDNARLVRIVRTKPGGEESTTIYDRRADGAVLAMRFFRGTEPNGTHTFGYAGELLMSVEVRLPDGYLLSREDWTYHPNRKRATRRFESFPPASGGTTTLETYDAEGRLLRMNSTTDKSTAWAEWKYGPDASASRTNFGTTQSARDEWTEYDEGMRPLRVATDQTDFAADGPVHHLVSRRMTYACGTGELLLEELDKDADGQPDGWRTLTYDAAGNVLLEEMTGSAAPFESSISRVEYDYSCRTQ